FFYIAPPFAVIFTLGLLWRRANSTAALTTIVAGFVFTVLVHKVLVPYVPVMALFRNFYHRALLAWFFCMGVMIVTSLLTRPPPREKTEGIVWTAAYAQLPEDLRRRYSGLRDFRIWWALFVILILALYGFFAYWRI